MPSSRPSTEQLLAQARAAHAETGRIPLPEFTTWDTFPFEGELVVKPLAEAAPEPLRNGEGGVDCYACGKDDEDYLWTDAQWRVRATKEPTGLPAVLFLEPRGHYDLADLPEGLLASLGPTVRRVERALLSLGGIARVHVSRWGDGGAHLHFWFFPRPEGFVQGLGAFLPQWDDILPPRPEPEWRQTLDELRRALAD